MDQYIKIYILKYFLIEFLIIFLLNIYIILTLLATFYYLYDLYTKESSFFLFSMHLLKSKFYFCLSLNFFIMVLVISGRLLIKVFYGDVRLSELTQVIEKMRLKFFQLLIDFCQGIQESIHNENEIAYLMKKKKK